MAVVDSPDEGRIPFRIRIGVAGHVTLDEHDERLIAAVREQVERIGRLLEPTAATQIRFTVVTALAKGGDRIVTSVVAEDSPGATVEIVLPLDNDAYARKQQFDQRDRELF